MNLSHRTDTFTDSVIRRMTRVCLKFCEDLARIVGVGAVPGSSFLKKM
ncbi:hypothetical protein [Catenibacterium mitsuokai]|nr:hypothetical protein [Catenibacterium mitsuokai]